MTFTYVKKPSAKKIKDVAILGFPVMCNTDQSTDGSLEDPQTLDWPAYGGATVKQGEFKYQVTQQFVYTIRLFGSITRTGASGTMQYFGKTTINGETRYCETDGKLPWTAAKVVNR